MDMDLWTQFREAGNANDERGANGDSRPRRRCGGYRGAPAVAEALSVKKRLGLSAVTWKDGRIVVIPPEEIEVDEELLKQYGNQPYIVD